MKAETGKATAEAFYREEWWPWMCDLARQNQLKYTGMLVETYNNQTQGPFPEADARNTAIAYGHALLNMGGELGLHGYNHELLTTKDTSDTELGYTPWPDAEEMEAATKELYRYAKSLYPDYTFQVYVPASNILDADGAAVVQSAIPTLRCIASLYNGPRAYPGYYQTFHRDANGIYQLPRISSGYMPDAAIRLSALSELSHRGVFAHFVHPDQIFYASSEDQHWSQMKAAFTSFLADLTARYPWLTPVTASESLPYFEDFDQLDYRVQRTENYCELHVWGHSGEVRFLLRSQRELDHADGCTAEVIGEDCYLVRMTGTQARLYWRDDAS